MKIAIPKEHRDGETRVAISPAVAKKLVGLGFQVVVEKGAGEAASIPDSALTEAGATIAKDAAAAMKDADVVLKVNPPVTSGTGNEIAKMKKGAVLMSQLSALNAPADMAAIAKAGITSFAMELVPRISRAQSMDVLSSQANLAGYRAVLEAAAEYGRGMPMMMTAAGTVPPAKAFIMGVGVAGLQAIATAKRLGSVVTATDVRPATKEQVESLGGKFLEVDPEMEKDAQTDGGYAKEMPPEYYEKQKAVVAEHIKKQDIVITTALIPGRPAPKLITKAMVESMQPGAVIVDLAVEAGGNCELAELGKVAVTKNGVKIVGYANLPGRLSETASELYAKNLLNFLQPFAKDGALTFDWEDEVILGSLVTRDGDIVNERVKEAAAKAAPKKRAAAKPKAPAKPKSTAKTATKSVTKPAEAKSDADDKTAPTETTAEKSAPDTTTGEGNA